MCPANHLELISMIELLTDILAKGVACSSWTDTPSSPLIWVTPQKIAHGSFMGHFLHTFQSVNVVEGVGRGGKSSVQTEESILHYGR